MAKGLQSVAEALLDVGGLKFSSADPFVYASRKIGPVYVDVRQLSSKPARWSDVVEELVSLIDLEVGVRNFDVVSGGELADLLFSIPVALRTGKPHLMIRKTAKTYGTGGRIVGTLERGKTVVHVSDLVTSGTSAAGWVTTIRGAGGKLNHYFAVFDRKQGGDETLRSMGVKVHSLLSMDADFVKFAAKGGMITLGAAESILAYLADPEKWARTFLRKHPEMLAKRVAAIDGHVISREGIEILTAAYPDLVAELGYVVRDSLRKNAVKDRVEEVGYVPK